MAKPKRQPSPPPWRRRLLLGVCAALLLVVLVQLFTWPDVEALTARNPTTSAFIKAYERRSGERAQQRWAPYGGISLHLKKAVVVSEDLEFFSHEGFSTHEMKAALKDAIEEKRAPRGASTLSQQLAKNLWLTPSRNPWRKAKEALLTHQMETHLSKTRILEIYLNVVEFGPGIYGAEMAARHYFGTSAAGLTRQQAAQLAAALPNPRQWNPAEDSPTARRRAARILARMEQVEWLDPLL